MKRELKMIETFCDICGEQKEVGQCLFTQVLGYDVGGAAIGIEIHAVPFGHKREDSCKECNQTALYDASKTLPQWNNHLNLQKQLAEAERKLGDLLARIHRDGGHYTGQHGMEKSVEDAHTIVANLFADERTLEEAERKLRAAKAELEACRADDSGAAICRAAECLPNGYEVCIIVERGAATVTWHYPDGRSTNVDVDADDRLTAEINAATDAAIDAARREES